MQCKKKIQAVLRPKMLNFQIWLLYYLCSGKLRETGGNRGKVHNHPWHCATLAMLSISIALIALLALLHVAADGLCTDTRCGSAAKICCEGSPALQKKSICVGSVECDSCCGWVSRTVPTLAQNWISTLGLQKQEFGNFFGITYTSEIQVKKLPSSQFPGGSRRLHGDIYNLFTINRSDTTNAQAGFPLHMLEDDETYHYYAGDGALTLIEFHLDSLTVKNISIGNQQPGRDVPQYTIPSRTWTGALLAKGSTTWALTGAGTTPGFDPRDSKMAADNTTLLSELYQLFPNHTGLIRRLTSFH